MTQSELPTGNVINALPLGTALEQSKHVSLLDTEFVKMKRLVLLQGKELSEHKAPGEITVQCLEGCIAFTCRGKELELKPGQLVHLHTGELHSVRAIESSSFLLTIFQNGKLEK